MAVAAAPAPPTLAAARPQVVHARPLTAQRAHLAPANRRQAPARLREAPAAHKQMCTFYSWAHSHAQHLAHFLATHVHARSTAAARRRQQPQRQRRQRRQRQRQQRRRELSAMVYCGSIQSWQSRSTGSRVVSAVPTVRRMSLQRHPLRVGFSSAQTASRVILNGRGRQ